MNIQLSRLQLACDPRKLPFCFIFSKQKKKNFLGRSCCLIYVLRGPDVGDCAVIKLCTDVHGYMHVLHQPSVQCLILRALQLQGRGLIGCKAVQEGPCCPLPVPEPVAGFCSSPGFGHILKHVALCKTEQLKPFPLLKACHTFKL